MKNSAMKKVTFLLCTALILSSGLLKAQNEDEENEKKGFKKENLFTGGSIALGFTNNTFLVGGSPVFGYSLTNWLDAGIVANYNYSSYRDYQGLFNAKLRQKNYGGGGFIRLFPVRFLFAQAQYEHNWLRFKYIPPNNNSPIERSAATGNSFLIGGGYSTGREPGSGQPFFYLSVLFDIGDDVNSPYTDEYGRAIPIIRGGIQVPLFQGRGRSSR
jgi:hypothetical protein